MKKNVIALAVAAAVAAPVANAAPTVYGIANAAFTMNAGGKDTGQSIDNVASRLGVKGSEDLGSGLKAVYKFEFSVNGFDGGAIGNRNQFVGLAGGFGTVLMGRHDTPVKMSQPKDLFNDSLMDNGKMTGIGWKGGENRINNVLAYVSPSFGGVKLVAALSPGEGGTDDSSISNTMSVAAMYGSKKKGLYLAAAYESADEYSLGATKDSYTRISAQYTVAGLVANAMYQTHAEDTADFSANNIMIGLGYKMGNVMPKLKYSLDDGDSEGSTIALGVDYKLGKKTKTYLEYGMYDEDMATARAGAAADAYNTLQLGLQHKF